MVHVVKYIFRKRERTDWGSRKENEAQINDNAVNLNTGTKVQWSRAYFITGSE